MTETMSLEFAKTMIFQSKMQQFAVNTTELRAVYECTV